MSTIKRKKILSDAIGAVSEDTKLVRLATLTTFIHSLLFIVYLIYLLFTLSQTAAGETSSIGKLISDYIDIVAPSTEIMILLVIIAIVLLIGYLILPPVGDAAMIYYVDSEKKSGTMSLGSGFSRFFPMFEFNATISFLNIVAWSIAASRMWTMGIINRITITLLSMWFLVSLLALFLLPYTKFIITLEKENYFEAMKRSMGLALKNIGTTTKFVIINLFLYLRFIINILLVAGIPILIIYFASKLDLAESDGFKGGVIAIVILLVALTAYINGIIEAFFISYRWRVYRGITESPSAQDKKMD